MIVCSARVSCLDAGEGLDDGHVAEGVGGVFGETRVVALDGALKLLRLAHHDDGEDREDRDEGDEQEPEPPVEEERQRQQDAQGDEGGKMLPEEAEPQPGHAVRALEHHLQHAARMGRRVEGERQFEDVLEIVRHDAEPPPVGEPVRMERHEHAGPDGEQSERHPGDDERPEGREGDRRVAGALPAGEHVDDPPEQDGLGEGRDRQRDVGGGKPGADLEVGTELAEDARIETDQPHGRLPYSQAGAGGEALVAASCRPAFRHDACTPPCRSQRGPRDPVQCRGRRGTRPPTPQG